MTLETGTLAPGSLRGDDRTYSGYRRPGIRLSEPLDPLLAEGRTPSAGPALIAQALHRFDKAHTVMLAERGIIPRDGAAAILRALRAMEGDGVEKVRAEVGGGIHSGETYLIRQLGMEVGGLIHAGRSSWDLTRVSHRIALRHLLLEVMEALLQYRAALLQKAAEHLDTVMPYYTHGQQGQPTTFAHHLHAFVCAAERDFQRLDRAFAIVNISPAGSAAGTASRFPTDRERVAELLGFERVSTNTRDSSYNADHLWETAAALGIVAGSLGFLADELILWMGNEFGLVRLADRYCNTSSIMTQKRNPTAAEQVQAVRARLTGRVLTSYTAPELMEAAEQVVRALRLCAGMVETLIVNRELMRERTARSWAQASDLATVLVQEKGLSWRMAHQTVGIMVRLAEEEGVQPHEATPELLDRAALLFLGRPLGLDAATFARALDPVLAVQQRQVTGSPGPQEMARQVAASQQLLQEDEEQLRQRRQRLAEADGKLERAVDAIIG